MKYFVKLGDSERFCPHGMIFEIHPSDQWDEFRCQLGYRQPVPMWEDSSGYVVDL